MRVVSWNLHFRAAASAQLQGELLRKLRPDLMLLQEVNLGSVETLRLAAEVDWMICSPQLRPGAADNYSPGHKRVAIAGRGTTPQRVWSPSGVQFPERILLAETIAEGLGLTAVSYHAPPGVTYGIAKAQQAVTFARWLAVQQAPVLLGADANTPKIDAVDFAATRTWWDTGRRRDLNGEPGEDLLFGPAKIHPLQDGLRCWLADHPAEMAALADRPKGPLAITHYTGKRKNSPGNGRRYDSIWLTEHWTVRRIEHYYDEAIAADSDHALVVAELDAV